MAKRVTELEKEKMWRLFQDGHSIQKIAEKTHRNRSTVSRYVKEYEAKVTGARLVLNAQAET